MTAIYLTADQICAIHSWPFPCERGEIVSPELVLHPFGRVFVDRLGGATLVLSFADQPASRNERSEWLALATGATIGRAMTAQKTAELVEEARVAVFASNQAAVGKFVATLMTSPPTCDPIIPIPVPIWVGGIGGTWIFIPLPPPPPMWKDGEQLSGIDLLAVGTRFQAAAAASDSGPLKDAFLAAGEQLLEAGAARL